MLFALLSCWLAAWSTAVHAGDAFRVLPPYFEDQIPFRVLIEVAPPTGTQIHSLEESIPSGFNVQGVNYGGIHDPAHQVIRWGPFLDGLPRTLTYVLTAPLDAPALAGFHGAAVFQSTPGTVAGPTSLSKRAGLTTRNLPDHYLPGQPVAVSLSVHPGASIVAWALQETLPSGWQPAVIPADASFDPVTRTLKWGPFLDTTPRELSYSVRPPEQAREAGTFGGHTHFDSTSVPIAGTSTLTILPNTVTRRLPAPYTAGQIARVELAVQPAPYVAVHAMEEEIPPGLVVEAVGQGAAWDPQSRRVKWGPFPDAAARTLTYDVRVPAQPRPAYELTGRGVFESTTVPTLGPTSWSAADLPPSSQVTSSLAAHFDPLLALPIDLDSSPAPGTRVHALELSLPDGWAFLSASHGAAFDPRQRRIKWGPFEDAAPRRLHAEIRPPSSPTVPTLFTAVGWFDALEVPATGNLVTRPFPSAASRTLPARVSPGVPFAVRLDLQPAPGVQLTVVEESVPNEAGVAAITEGGTYDPVQRKIKWGPFAGAVRRTLSYQATLAGSAWADAEFSGMAVFDTAATPITGTAILALNHPPSAQSEFLQRPPATTAKFSILELLANDSDTDGDALRVRSVAPRSAAGGSAQLLGPWVFYEAPGSGVPAEDQISYTIEDAFGASAVASVTLQFTAIPATSRLAILSVLPQPGGRALVRFRAVPGTACRIEVSRDLRTWTSIGEATAGSLGIGELLDPDADAFPVRFYRVAVLQRPPP